MGDRWIDEPGRPDGLGADGRETCAQVVLGISPEQQDATLGGGERQAGGMMGVRRDLWQC